MRRLGILTAIGLLLAPAVPMAQTGADPEVETFADLVAVCARTDDAVSMAFCHGFILGNGRLYVALRRAEAVGRWACADPVPTLSQISGSIVDWASANPQHAGEDAVDGLWRAAATIYPCP